MGFWNFCTHSETTEPDRDGKALCLRCGEVHQVRLTEQLMADTFEIIRRDNGPHGRHSMRCVDTPDGWVCADNCRML